MAKYRITAPDGGTYEINAPDDATPEQVMAFAQKNYSKSRPAAQEPPAKGFGAQLEDAIRGTPRQLGLTARYGVEGLGGVFDTFAGNPMRAIAGQPSADTGGAVANLLGLPKPQNAGERVVGDAARMVAGGALPIGVAGQLAKTSGGTARAVAELMAARPGMQLASAGAAGGAGAYTRETGGGSAAQFLASLGAGLATPAAMAGAQKLAGGARGLLSPLSPQAPNIDITINQALAPSGVTLDQLPASIASGIRQDVSKAMNFGNGVLSPDAVRRLADYRLTGLTPTAATVSRDPAMYTQQANLAKIGANSKDPAAQALAQVQNSNNRALIEGLNQRGAATADDLYAGGEKIMGALAQRNARAKDLIGQQYEAARSTGGRSASLDPYAFTQRANDMLDQALLGGKLPGDVRNLLNQAATGKMPLTVDVAEQFKTRIGELQRATNDMAERKALGLVRSALDDAPLLPGQEMGAESIAAFNKARALNRTWMGIVDRTPALQAVRDGIEPDKFVQQFILGGGGKSNVNDVQALKNSIKGSPEAMDAVRSQIVAHLKKQALNGAADEVGNFSQSGYNKALQAIGDRKLKLFFDSEDINTLKAYGRVASYDQVQPKGSAVNNSNTAGALAGMLERVADFPLLSKIPFGAQIVADPLQNIAVGMQAKRAVNIPPSLLLRTMPQRQPQPLLLSPAAFAYPYQDPNGSR
jgi:hypothetical protein